MASCSAPAREEEEGVIPLGGGPSGLCIPLCATKLGSLDASSSYILGVLYERHSGRSVSVVVNR